MKTAISIELDVYDMQQILEELANQDMAYLLDIMHRTLGIGPFWESSTMYHVALENEMLLLSNTTQTIEGEQTGDKFSPCKKCGKSLFFTVKPITGKDRHKCYNCGTLA